jgi:hypothetical protein
MQQITIQGYTLEQLVEALTPLLQPTLAPEKPLTRQETIDFFGIDSSTLNRWVNNGKITQYGIGARRYFIKSELWEALIPTKLKRKPF